MLRQVWKVLTRSAFDPCAKVCCLHCHTATTADPCDFFCKTCKTLLPPQFADYFQLFDQPRKFTVDVNALDATFRKYQGQIHPDKFFDAPKDEKDRADTIARCVNEGYATLKDPQRRGEYLLSLLGETPPESPPQAFLRDILEFHEAPYTLDAVERVDDLVRAEETALGKALEAGNTKGAAEMLTKLRFLTRLRVQLKEKAAKESNT